MQHGVNAIDADEVIKNMMAEIAKRKPGEVNEKRADGKRMMLAGVVIFAVGAVLAGTDVITIGGQTIVLSYGIMVTGAIVFFKGLIKMF